MTTVSVFVRYYSQEVRIAASQIAQKLFRPSKVTGISNRVTVWSLYVIKGTRTYCLRNSECLSYMSSLCIGKIDCLFKQDYLLNRTLSSEARQPVTMFQYNEDLLKPRYSRGQETCRDITVVEVLSSKLGFVYNPDKVLGFGYFSRGTDS